MALTKTASKQKTTTMDNISRNVDHQANRQNNASKPNFIYHGTEKLEGDSSALCSHCDTNEGDDWILCDKCEAWYHCSCINIDPELYIGENAPKKDEKFLCNKCEPFLFDDINLSNEQEIDTTDSDTDTLRGSSSPSQINIDVMMEVDTNYSHEEFATVSASQASNNGLFFDATNIENTPVLSQSTQVSVISVSSVNKSDEEPDSSATYVATTPLSSNDTAKTRKEDELFTVEKILKHRGTSSNGYQYLIKWEGYDSSENTWEPETGLTNCYKKVSTYKFNNKLGKPVFPKPTERVGFSSSNEDTVNLNNWAHPKDIVKAAMTYRDNRREQTLPIHIINPESNYVVHKESAIYIIDLHPHAYVALCPENSKQVIVADGGNLLGQEQDVLTLMSKIFSREVRNIPFKGQGGIDHCASSAAAIINELERIHVNNWPIPEILTVAKSKHERIVKKFHKDPSANVIGQKIDIRDNIVKFKCHYDRCSFTTRKKVSLSAHMLKCPQKN